MKTKSYLVPLAWSVLLIFMIAGCGDQTEDLSIDYEKYTLENGMDVVLHQDTSDPIVAVAIQYHVGSNREKPGKTGFAHLFEHMMFQESENVGQDEFFQKIQRAGGTLNGGTSMDGTIYFEIVPKNAAEMVLWLESDRMGYMINTVTKSAFANQQDVVINEKRQMVDNRPYGHNNYVIHKALYPASHPYNWQVIGEMEDLFNATVEDVKDFHQSFYVPNNATLVIAGDFETEEMKALVEKYFGEIPSGETVTDLDPMPVSLDETKRLYHEDNYAKTPLMTMVWPVVEQYNPDAYALDFLAQILGRGKKAPMYKVLVKDKKLTSRASVYNSSMELTGKFTISVPANAGTDIDEVEAAVFEAFSKFEEDGITETDMEKIKAGLETQFYNGISSVLGKAFQLARYNEYAGNPGFITEDINNIKAVTIDDVMRVYETYIKDKPYVISSFVPKGSPELAAENSEKAGIVEESIENAVKVAKVEETEEVIEKTPSSFDRSVEPEFGPDPIVTVPSVWESNLDNGMKVLGIEHHELPLVNYSIDIKGGHLMDEPGKAGVADMLATMLMEGTATKTPEELEEAIELLGANIWTNASQNSFSINVNTLERNVAKTIDLVQEILLEPRWDEEEFKVAKMKVVNNLKRNAASPNYISSMVFNRLLFGENNNFSLPVSGTIESVESITMDDLKAYYEKNISPNVATLIIAGDIAKETVEEDFAGLSEAWESKPVTIPTIAINGDSDPSKIYFVDVPGSSQSVIRIGRRYKPADHFENYAATVANYKLGGAFNGNLNMILREEKGFTYGARSGFYKDGTKGYFYASSSVRSDATLEAVQIFHDEMAKYRQGIPEDDLSFTKEALLKSNALEYETLRALQGMLRTINEEQLPFDYIQQEQEILRNMTLEKHKTLVNKYIDPDNMVYVVVGDAATQMEPLKALGFDVEEVTL